MLPLVGKTAQRLVKLIFAWEWLDKPLQAWAPKFGPPALLVIESVARTYDCSYGWDVQRMRLSTAIEHQRTIATFVGEAG
jgi:hypothetical protein